MHVDDTHNHDAPSGNYGNAARNRRQPDLDSVSLDLDLSSDTSPLLSPGETPRLKRMASDDSHLLEM